MVSRVMSQYFPSAHTNDVIFCMYTLNAEGKVQKA